MAWKKIRIMFDSDLGSFTSIQNCLKKDSPLYLSNEQDKYPSFLIELTFPIIVSFEFGSQRQQTLPNCVSTVLAPLSLPGLALKNLFSCLRFSIDVR